MKMYAVLKNGIVIDFTNNPDREKEESSIELICIDDIDNDEIPIMIGSSYINGKFIPSEDNLKEIAEREKGEKFILFFNLRQERNKRLVESDLIMFRHLEKNEPIPEKLKQYRQILRDIPQNTTDVQSVEWPSYDE